MLIRFYYKPKKKTTEDSYCRAKQRPSLHVIESVVAQTTGSHNFMGEIDGSGYIFECGWISRRDRVLDNLLQICPQLRESNGRHRDYSIDIQVVMSRGLRGL